MHIIGIDVGGTKIAGILFDGKKIVKTHKVETKKNKKEFLAEICALVDELSVGKKIKGIGIGIPGVVDREKGVIVRMPNVPELGNIKLGPMLEKKYKTQVRMEKDANCMAVAEHKLGIGKGKKNVVCITLGTGIGGGIIANGEVYIGRGSAGEIGHINIEPEGLLCNCGNRGCFEEYASGRGVVRMAKELGLNGKPRDIENMARAGNKKAIEVHKKLGYYLGVGISSIIKTLDPELIVISGSIARASDLFLEDMKREIAKRVFFGPCEIKISKLEEDPALGAACLFLK
jgi:glucokinase